MAESKRLPLKVVPTLERDFYHPESGGGPKKVFTAVTPEFRQKLSSQVIEIRDHFSETFREFPKVPAVARVRVREDAIAKSHRPTEVFTAATCPIIGAEGLGDLLVSVTNLGLENLARKIEDNRAKETVANLSTLESLEAYMPRVDRPTDNIAKVKLFRHNQPVLDEAVDETFYQLVKRFGVREPRPLRYGRGLKIYRIEVQRPELIDTLQSYVGTQSIGPFPLYGPVRSTAVTIRSMVAEDFPSPESNVEYPVVGIIDSGTAASDRYMSPWRVTRDVHVSEEEQDNTHGSLVAGLIVHPRRLNHGDERFPRNSARIVDVVALGKNGTTEDKLISTLEQALESHPEVKVWNLSLGTEKGVTDRTFSDLGVTLDRLQDEYGVTFVVAAGNYRNPPFRGWPPENLGEADRVCAPADSVRAVVVGSVAHRDHSSSRVKAGEPSPFSRRGPGPLYLPKPELSHVGGNCNASGESSQIGVLSLDGRGNVAEDVGTSYAAPLVTNLTANLNHRLAGDSSLMLCRALLVHAAALRGGKIDPQLLRYQGFGMPPDLDTILGCDPWQCTLIFELEIHPTVAYEKATFPMPKCLYLNESTVRANILMTLVHEPDLDASFGSEYCRSNIEVSLGTYEPGKDGKRHQKKQVPEDPKLSGSAYEQDLVEHGFKWSPVKVYRREMVRGVRGKSWRLDLSLHHRAS
ncbi:MAG: S8 family peptidase, partial [Acidobacteria bacterium]|nr:S8 family peptidase [Acidobacteriota bacterium]